MSSPRKLPLSILILAGGRGSRMGGRDKGLVEFNQQPFVEHMLSIASPYSDDIIISCNRNQARYQRYGETLVEDEQDDFPGPLAGILAGMEKARHEALLVLPCDTPMIPADLPEQLYRSFCENRSGISLVNDGERRQPLHAIMPTSLKESLREFLAGDQHGVYRWYRQHPVTEVVYRDQSGAFVNINRPEELRALDQQKDSDSAT